MVESTVGQTWNGNPAESRTERCLAETRRVVDDLLAKYCALKGKPRWCEKTPSNLEHLKILRSVFPDARYVCLHRHCLDAVISSIEMDGESPPHMKDYIDRNDGSSAAGFIERWCDRTERLMAFEAENPASAFRVTYESLVTDTEAVLRGIQAFVGVEWVPGLSERVFSMSHDAGVGDLKIAGSIAIATNRMGKGRQLDLAEIRTSLCDRMRRLLDALGYQDEPTRGARPSGAQGASRLDGPARSRLDLTSVEELFTRYFPDQLTRCGHRLANATDVVTIIVTGSGGGTWAIRPNSSGRYIVAADAGGQDARWTVTIASADLLDVANRKSTLAEALFSGKLGVRGDMDNEGRELGEQLAWALFGDDFRPAP